MQIGRRTSEKPKIEINRTHKTVQKVASETKIPRPPSSTKQYGSPSIKKALSTKFRPRFSKTAQNMIKSSEKPLEQSQKSSPLREKQNHLIYKEVPMELPYEPLTMTSFFTKRTSVQNPRLPSAGKFRKAQINSALTPQLKKVEKLPSFQQEADLKRSKSTLFMNRFNQLKEVNGGYSPIGREARTPIGLKKRRDYSPLLTEETFLGAIPNVQGKGLNRVQKRKQMSTFNSRRPTMIRITKRVVEQEKLVECLNDQAPMDESFGLLEELQGQNLSKQNLKMVKLVSSCHTLEHLNCNLNKAKTSGRTVAGGESEASHSFKMDSPHFNSQAFSQSRFITQSSGQIPKLEFSSNTRSPIRKADSHQQLIYYNFTTFKKFWELREKTKLVQRSPNFYAYCRHLPEGNWMPRNREGATLNKLDDYSAVLFGDTRLGNALSSQTEAFKLDFNNDGKWAKLSVANPEMLYSRMNHATCDVWDQSGIFIFGGEILFRPMPGQTSIKQQVQNRKECSNDLLFLDFRTTSIHSIHYKSKVVEPRRAHILERFGKTLILYGGMNHFGQIKRDVWYYDVESNEFQEQEIFVNHLGSIAFAASCAVFYPRVEQEGDLSVKQPGSINWKIVENFIRQEGIYIFGGKKNKEELNDAVYVMEITSKNEEGPLSEPQITEVCTYGAGPCPRYQHTMQYYAKKNQIIVVGGRNDYEYQERGEVIFNDIYLLSLDTYTWSQMILKQGPVNYPRSNHACILLNDRLIIYGGVDRNFKLIGEIDIIELDEDKVNHYYDTEEKKLRKMSTRHSTLDQSSYLHPPAVLKQISSSRLLTPQHEQVAADQGNQRYQQRTPDQLWLNTINQVEECDQTFAKLRNYEREEGSRSRSPTHPRIGISLIPEMLGFEERYTQRFLNEKKHMFQKRRKETMTPKADRAPKQPLMMFYSKPEKYVIDETNYMTPYMADLEGLELNDEFEERE